jgi:anti-sigma factor RsiW
MNMKCQTVKTLICDFADGKLPSALARPVEGHIASCEACARILDDVRSAGRAMHLLPGADVPSQFRERLARRLADTPPTPPVLSGLIRAREWVRVNVLWTSGHVLRPVLALGAVAVLAFAFNIHDPSLPTPPVLQAAKPADAKLISQCVALHQNEVAAEPVTDWAAVNLAERMDDSLAADDGAAGDLDTGI